MPIAALDSIKFDEQPVGTPIESVQFDEPQTVGQKIAKPFKAQAYTAMEGLQSGVSNVYQGMDDITKYLQDKTGLSRGGAFEKAAKLYAEKADYWHQKAQEVGANKIDEVIGQAVGGAVPGITEFMLNVPYAALLGAAKSHNEGNSEALGAITEGAKRYAMGKVLHATGVLKQPSRSAVMGGVFGAQTAAEGGSPEDIASSVGTGVLYGIPGNGKVGLREFVKPKQKSDEIPTYEAELVEQPPAQIEGTKIAGQLEAPPTAINMPGPAKSLALPAPDTTYGEGFTAKPATQRRPGYTAGEATDYEPEVEIQPVLNRSGQPYRDEASARKAAAARHIGDYDIKPLGSGYAIYPRIPREAPKPVEPAPQPRAVEEMSVDELLQNRAELSKQHTPARINDLIIAKQAARLESGDISAPKTPKVEPEAAKQEIAPTGSVETRDVDFEENAAETNHELQNQSHWAQYREALVDDISHAAERALKLMNDLGMSGKQRARILAEVNKATELEDLDPIFEKLNAQLDIRRRTQDINRQPESQPVEEAAPYKAEAERLGIQYEGPMEDTVLHTFTDPATKSTFYVKPGESVEAKMLSEREKWKAKEGTPSSQIKDDQLLNGKTYPQIEQGIIEGRNMEAEIRSVAEERSFPDFEDWMNDGKMKARIVDVLKEQGMESKAARSKADDLIKPYAEAYKKVHGELEAKEQPATGGEYIPIYRGTGQRGFNEVRSTQGGVMGDGVYFYTNPIEARSHATYPGGGVITGYAKPSDLVFSKDGRVAVLKDVSKFDQRGKIPLDETSLTGDAWVDRTKQALSEKPQEQSAGEVPGKSEPQPSATATFTKNEQAGGVNKPALSKIGDTRTVAGVESNLVDAQTFNGVRYEIWSANSGKENRAAVRIFDEDGGETVALRQYPDYEKAAKDYYNAITKEGGEVPGRAKPKAAIQSKENKPQPGLAHVTIGGKSKQSYFTEYREITKGKDKGKIMITLPGGKKVKVEKKAVVRMPEAKASDTAQTAQPESSDNRPTVEGNRPIEPIDNPAALGDKPSTQEPMAAKPEKGGSSITLGSGLGGLQPIYEKLAKALSERGYNASETAIKFGKDLARFVQVRPEQILRKYAPKSGTKASRENDTVIRRQRMLKGNWETRYHDASDKLTKSDRDWVVANFKNVYERGGSYPNERIKHFAKTWNQISGEVIELAQKLGVQERVEVDKWAVFKGENKSPTRVFPNQKLAEQFISEQNQPDLYTSIMTGEKMVVTRPVTARKNYFPHVLTEQAQEALRTQNAVYAALKEAAGVNGIDIEALAQEYRPSQSARRYGSLENARVANLPNKVIVDGKEVPILETNPLQIIQQHIERGANRLAIIERYGQEGATKFFDDLYNEITREAKDQGVANQWMWMWQKMNGTAKDGFTESFKDNPYIGELLGNLENYGRVAKLSAATALNVITGPVPISARYGTARTTAAIMKVGAASAAKRLGVKLPFTDAIMKDIERYSMLGGHSNEALRVTADTTDIHSNIANTLMRGYGMNAINVFLNKVANHAADGAMRDALSSLRKGVDNNAIKRLWGMDKKALTDFLKNEGDFTDADIARMVKEGPTGDDVARLVQKSSTVTNLFEENAATLPASMSNGWWRRLFSYTSWFRMMGATVADSAAYAKQGNLRPLATLLTGAAATQVIADEVMGYLKGRVDQDESFFEKVFDVFAQSGLIGIAGPLMENVKWSSRQGDSPLGMPNYGFWWDVSYGMYNAAKKALDQNPSRGAEDAYKTFIKNVPLLRIIDNVLEGPYSRYLEGRYGSHRDSILNNFQGDRSSSVSHSSSSRGASSRTSTSR